jgi:hypothetical protein
MIQRVTSEPDCTCIGCGCKDSTPCREGADLCSWERMARDFRVGVCSRCAALVEAWDAARLAWIQGGRGNDFLDHLKNAGLIREQ